MTKRIMNHADTTVAIGIVGSGPTAIYTLKGLLEAQAVLRIVMFERTAVAGTGSPYRKGTNDAELLANIASIELPVVMGTLEDWLKSQTAIALEDMGIERSAIDDREFFPRVAIGSYFQDQLFHLVQRAQEQGSTVEICTNHDVQDIQPMAGGGAVVAGKISESGTFKETFDYVVIATGHDLEDEEVTVDPEKTFFDSPYPSSSLKGIRACRVGILGTSLSGIDATITVAMNHGSFEETDKCLLFHGTQTAAELQITMLSRNGVLPEADFFCPIPYEPLSVFTQTAVESLIDRGHDGLLNRAVDLFKHELVEADPDYASEIALSELDADTFPDAYFRPREEADPFAWAKANLEEVKANRIAKRTVAWKYAILRMHELFETIVRHLSDEDRKRFDGGMKKLFVDNYAAIPPLSIERLLALHERGLLEVKSLGDDYEIEDNGKGHSIRTASDTLEFDVVIDATGQRRAERELPFPTLKPLWELAAKEASEDGDVLAASIPGIYMAALPYMLRTRPFVQGLPSCEEIGAKVAGLIREAIAIDYDDARAA